MQTPQGPLCGVASVDVESRAGATQPSLSPAYTCGLNVTVAGIIENQRL